MWRRASAEAASVLLNDSMKSTAGELKGNKILCWQRREHIEESLIGEQFGKLEGFTLLDIFAYLNRSSLDAVQFASYRFHSVISKKMTTQCLRPIQHASIYYRPDRSVYVTSTGFKEPDAGSADQQQAVSLLMSRCRSAFAQQLDLGKVALISPAMEQFLKGASLVFTQKLRLQARNGAFDEARSVLNHCLEAGIPELVMKDFTVFKRLRGPELGHDTGISEDDILLFCFEPNAANTTSRRVLALESSAITSRFVERLLDYAARKEYAYGIKLVVLAHEPQTAFEDHNKLWHASVEGRLIFSPTRTGSTREYAQSPANSLIFNYA